ncbi:MAG: NAD-dependent epimerase/dehydratase family protein [Myxococcota bacterium]
MATIFLTGGSGFIGGAIAERLSREHRVIGLSRSERSDRSLEARGAEPCRGDLGDPGTLPEHDVTVHCAAYVEPWGSREDFWEANVEGTTRLLAAASRAGARRFVHMSTEAVLWYGQDLVDVDETHPYPERTPILYSETKAEAERRVLAANTEAFTTLALRPRFVWGPGDTTLVPSVKEMVEKGAFTWIDGGQAETSTTHIANLVHATELALERGEGGRAYFVTDGENHRFADFLPRLMATAGVTLPSRSVPGWLVGPLAAAIESTWRILGLSSEPPLTRHAAGLLRCTCTLRDERARNELGYTPVVAVDEALEQLGAKEGARS